MTLDEAIEIYEIKANLHEREAEYHRPLGYSHEAIANVVEMDAREERQIAKWLKELKERRADRKTEPQTDCGDFADRLAYERGVKHAWEVAQKVFDSTVTFYEAEDVAKQIAKTEPQTSTISEDNSTISEKVQLKDEPQTEQVRCGHYTCHNYEACKKNGWQGCAYEPVIVKTEPQIVGKHADVIIIDEPQTCNDCDQQRCETCVTEIGKDEQTE